MLYQLSYAGRFLRLRRNFQDTGRTLRLSRQPRAGGILSVIFTPFGIFLILLKKIVYDRPRPVGGFPEGIYPFGVEV